MILTLVSRYPFSRGSTHIQSPDPYEAPDFDAVSVDLALRTNEIH
jgi:hypothetical protein